MHEQDFRDGLSKETLSPLAHRVRLATAVRGVIACLGITDVRAGEMDQFIPCARYPFDSPFNLVLASRKENNRMRDELKPEALRQRWLARNEAHLDLLVAPEPRGFGADEADRDTAIAVAGWVYRIEG